MTARRGPKDAIPNGSNRRYKRRNWPEYNAALKQRGSITYGSRENTDTRQGSRYHSGPAHAGPPLPGYSLILSCRLF